MLSLIRASWFGISCLTRGNTLRGRRLGRRTARLSGPLARIRSPRPLNAGVRRIGGLSTALVFGFGYPDGAAECSLEEVSMSAGSAKQKVLEGIAKLPTDAQLEDALERLVLLAKTERGLAELDAGQGVDHAEAKRRLLR